MAVTQQKVVAEKKNSARIDGVFDTAERIRIKDADKDMKRIATNNWTLGIMFGLGLNIAGSDGGWCPWINFIGVLMLGYVGLIANHLRPAPWR